MGGYMVRRLGVAVSAMMLTVTVLSGCGGGGGLQSLAIDPPEVTMQSRGENVQLKAVGKKTDGTLATDDDMELRWSYSDGSIASVDKSGLLRGVLQGEGTVSVLAEKYGTKATINVHVKATKYTPEEMQTKVQAVIDAVKALEVSPSTTGDTAAASDQLKTVLRSLSEASKYIGQGTNNTLASVELLNAANFMEAFIPNAKGALADGLASQAKLAKQYREDLFAY